MEQTIKLHFNPELQATRLEFEPSEFRTWDFVVGLLHMALEEAKMRKLQSMQAAAQQQLMAARQINDVRSLLKH